MIKKIQKRDANASKRSIVLHAIKLFSTRGYSGTSMDELAKACDLNKAMIFYYFKNKKGLYEAVMEEILQEIYKAITQKIDISKNPQEALDIPPQKSRQFTIFSNSITKPPSVKHYV